MAKKQSNSNTKTISIPPPIEYEVIAEGEVSPSKKQAVFQNVCLEFWLNQKQWGKSLETLELRKGILEALERGGSEFVIPTKAWEILLEVSCFPVQPYNPAEGHIVIPFLQAIRDAK